MTDRFGPDKNRVAATMMRSFMAGFTSEREEKGGARANSCPPINPRKTRKGSVTGGNFHEVIA